MRAGWGRGGTVSPFFPVTNPDPGAAPGSPARPPAGAFISQLAEDGRSLLYSTVLNGQADVLDLAVHNSGAVYATGVGAYALKLDPLANRLDYTRYLGGGVGRAIAVDAAGQAYLGGFTNDPRFGIRDALNPTYRTSDPEGNAGDGYLVKLDADGELQFGTYVGGSGIDAVLDLGLARRHDRRRRGPP